MAFHLQRVYCNRPVVCEGCEGGYGRQPKRVLVYGRERVGGGTAVTLD